MKIKNLTQSSMQSTKCQQAQTHSSNFQFVSSNSLRDPAVLNFVQNGQTYKTTKLSLSLCFVFIYFSSEKLGHFSSNLKTAVSSNQLEFDQFKCGFQAFVKIVISLVQPETVEILFKTNEACFYQEIEIVFKTVIKVIKIASLSSFGGRFQGLILGRVVDIPTCLLLVLLN